MVTTTVFVRYVRTAFGLALICMIVLSQCSAVVLADLQPHEPDDVEAPPVPDRRRLNNPLALAAGGGREAAVAAVANVAAFAAPRLVDDAADDTDTVIVQNRHHQKHNGIVADVDSGDSVGPVRAGDLDDSPYLQSRDPAAPPSPKAAATKAADSAYAQLGFVHGFLASLSVILVSELGDKTFFIAAIMAMRHPRLVVFAGAIGALGLMTVLSVVFGMAATIIPRVYTYYISTALFAIFGLQMLHSGWRMSPADASEELEEVQMDLKKREEVELERTTGERPAPVGGGGDATADAENTGSATLVDDPESGGIANSSANNRRLTAHKDDGGGGGGFISCLTSRVLVQAFTMTFVAEWGDRSQLTTIILGAREDAYGVIVGGVLGHMLCTGLAVIGGRMIAQRISVRTVTLVGGVVFLVFALSSLFMSPTEELPQDV